MSLTEALTTGWEADLPVEDTLLRRYVFHHADVNRAFVLAGGGRALDGPDFSAADLGRAAGYWNAATLVRPPSDWDDVIGGVERFFAGGRGEAMLWSAWPTPDLTGRGWRLSGHPPVLVRPPFERWPAESSGPPVEAVVDAEGLAAWERAAIEGYPFPDLRSSPARALAAPALLDDRQAGFWVGRLDGRPVAAGASYASRGIASLALGATAVAARGRGFWRSLAVARLRANPSVWFAGVFSDFSRPLAERLDFVPVHRLTLWTLPRP